MSRNRARRACSLRSTDRVARRIAIRRMANTYSPLGGSLGEVLRVKLSGQQMPVRNNEIVAINKKLVARSSLPGAV
jgi:hypothetical protein